VDGATRVILYGAHFATGLGPFSCRFDDTVQPATVEVFSGAVLCTTPRQPSPRYSVVEISLNGQQFHGSTQVAFRYYEAPAVLAISPASGTVVGGVLVTVYGTAFERSFSNLCRWGNYTTNVTSLAPSELVCASPPSPYGLVALEVSLNGQQYTSNGVAYSSYLHPAINRLSVPGFLGELDSWLATQIVHPIDGFTLVRAWGSGYSGGTDYRCKINRELVIAAVYDPVLDCVRCWSDGWLDGLNSVEVTLNGRQYTSDNVTIAIDPYW